MTISPLQAHASPELSLSPEEGQVGESITIEGTGFAALADIVIMFSGDEIPTSPETVTTNELGEFSADFDVPYFTSAGSIIIEAIEDSETATSASAEFTVINTPPVADELPLVTLEENESEVIILTGTDDNDDTLALEIVDDPDHGSIPEFDEDTGEVIYIPDEGYTGPDSFSFRANDGVEYSSTRLVSIIISGSNDAPVAYDKDVEVNENSKKKITLEVSAADEDSLSYSIVSDPDHGNLTGTPPNLTYRPYTDYTGPDSFRFRVTDSIGVSNIATVSILVITNDYEEYVDDEADNEGEYDYSNSKPVALSQSVTGEEDRPIQIVLSADDPDADPLTFEITDYPLYGEISDFNDSGELTYIPAEEYSGTDSFTFIAKDLQKKSKPATVSISISAVNDPPSPVSMNLTAAEGTANITLMASDPEGDSLIFAIYSEPANGTLIGTAPDLFYVAEPDFVGYDKFLFTVSDNRTDTWIGVVSILVEQQPSDEGNDDEQDTEDSGLPPGNSDEQSSDNDLDDHKVNPHESTSKARADKSKVLVMVSWDHHKQDTAVESTLHLKFAEVRTRVSLESHIWYDLVMLDDSNKEILRKNDLIAFNSEDIQQVIFPADGTYHFEVNVKGMIDKSNNEITRDADYTGKALGIVVVPEFHAFGILLTVIAIMGSIIFVARRKAFL
ncbi:MAG TPA: Ig-like domain-containing protein [Nitrososphaera sp.]|nr:Ig-like domain-containing protein [Nitrososphaera sp.]